MKITKLDHLSIATSCLERTRAFYVDVLGLAVGPRPKLKSTGYWLYSGDEALIHLVETGAARDGAVAALDAATSAEMIESGIDDHVALSVTDSASITGRLKELGIAYWDRLLADRGLYQVFVRDPNGVVLELNDYAPQLDAISPMAIQGRD